MGLLPVSNEYPWVACYYAVKWEGIAECQFDYILDKVKHHVGNNLYLVSKEISKSSHKETDGQHVHVLAQMTKQSYESLNKNIKDKFKLRGRPKDGNPKQYGKVKEIRDVDKMAAYILKDGNYVTNIPQEIKEKLIEMSYQKEDDSPSAESTKKKKSKSWIREVADSIMEEYPNSTWDCTHPHDYTLLEKILFDKLGQSAKALDEMIFERLFWGVYNIIPKTQRVEGDFRRSLARRVACTST